MKKIISISIVSIVFLLGCTHHIEKFSNESEADFYSRINKLCENKDKLDINTMDGKTYNAEKLTITKDTIRFISKNENTVIQKRINEIKSITFAQVGRGIYDGFLCGTLIGGGFGLATQLLLLNAEPLGKLLFVIYSGMAGAVIGPIYGIIHPSETTIIIHDHLGD